MSEDPRLKEAARFVDERLKKGHLVVDNYRKVGLLNEQFVLGNQWGATTWDGGTQRVDHDTWFTSEGVPKVHVNILAIVYMTWAALITQGRQAAKATQGSDDPEDAFTSELVNRLIEWICREKKTADVFMQAAQHGFQHGTAGVKHCWDPTTRQLMVAPLSIFNVVIGPSPNGDYKRAPWYAFQNYLDEERAEELFDRRGIKKKPKAERYKNAAGEWIEGVPHVEFWQRPCRDYKAGAFFSVVDREVVELIDRWPYTLEQEGMSQKLVRPLSLFRVRNIRESCYGATNLTDCVPLQRSYNETVARLMKKMRKATHDVLLVPSALKKHYQPGVDQIMWVPAAAKELAKEIRYVETPGPSQALYDLRDFFRASIYEVAGINEVTAGAETRSLSGRAIANIAELDAQKNADATRSFETMVVDTLESCIDLLRIFMPAAEKMRLTNSAPADVFVFDRAWIQGEVHLQPASEIDQLDDATRESIGEQQKMGTAGPLDLVKGLNAPSYGAARQDAELLVAAYLGDEQTPGVDIDEAQLEAVQPDVMAEVIAKAKARALNAGRREEWLALHALAQRVKAARGRQDTAQPAGAPGARPPRPGLSSQPATPSPRLVQGATAPGGAR